MAYCEMQRLFILSFSLGEVPVILRKGKTCHVILVCALVLFAAFPAHGGKPAPLTFLHYWTGGMSGGIDGMIDSFNRSNPKYRVRATGFDHESFKVGINGMLASGTPPDIFSYWAGAKLQSLVNKGLLAPIDDVWKNADLDKTFSPSVAHACTYNNHKYALPVTQHYVAFFYNKKIFQKLAITPPRTWGEFLLVCDRLKQTGITPLALGSRERWPAQFWFDYLLLRSAGPDYRQRLMEGKASYADPEVVKTFTIWKQLLDRGYFNGSPNLLDWTDASRLVHSGKAAMTLMGTWIIGMFDGQLNWKQSKDYDFFRFPIMDESVPLTALGPIDLMVAPAKGKAQQAKAVLAYFSDPGPQMEMSRGSGALSPSRAIPPSFYTPLQTRILSTIRNTPHWAFNYDLATQPAVAEHGLDSLKLFLEAPSNYRRILATLAKKANTIFHTSPNTIPSE